MSVEGRSQMALRDEDAWEAVIRTLSAFDASPRRLMSIARSRATTVSGVFDRVGSRGPATCTISFTTIGARFWFRLPRTAARPE